MAWWPIGLRKQVINYIEAAGLYDPQAILKALIFAGDCIGKNKIINGPRLAPQELEAIVKNEREAAVAAQKLARHLLMRGIDIHAGQGCVVIHPGEYPCGRDPCASPQLQQTAARLGSRECPQQRSGARLRSHAESHGAGAGFDARKSRRSLHEIDIFQSVEA